MFSYLVSIELHCAMSIHSPESQFSVLKQVLCLKYSNYVWLEQEHLYVTQDEAEVARMEKTIEVCKKTLIDLGHAEFTFEDFLGVRDYPLGL